MLPKFGTKENPFGNSIAAGLAMEKGYDVFKWKYAVN